MKRIGEDLFRGTVTYEDAHGRRADFDARAVREYGIADLARSAGLVMPTASERVRVMRDGEVIGTVPADFDPLFVKSRSPFYDVRPGDFRHAGDHWIAAGSIGPGDLDAIPGLSAASVTA